MASEPLDANKSPSIRRVSGRLRDCQRERHIASAKVQVDASGIEQCRCRVCGCELRRLSALRSWFRSGMMG